MPTRVPGLRHDSCAHCLLEDCPLDRREEETRLRGRPLGIAAVVMFVAPVLLAIVGAMSFRSSYAAELPGGLGGLAVGMLAARIIARRLAPGSKEDTSTG